MDMNESSIFFTLFALWYFGVSYKLYVFFGEAIQKTVDAANFIRHMNTTDIFDSDSDSDSESDEEPQIVKYEDKYLKEFRTMSNALKLDEREQERKAQKCIDLLNEIKQAYDTRINEIKEQIELNKDKLDKYNVNEDECHQEQKIKSLNDEITSLCVEFDNIHDEMDTKGEEIMSIVEEKTNQFMMDQRLEQIKNSYVIEFTPLGNVLMIYDKERESFKYYSDNSIPYRYLEVVGRKYAKQFGVKQIFVDMEYELQVAEEKWEKEKEEKVEKERIQKEEAIKNNHTFKKSVFAKFKNYNKDAGTGHVNIGAPPKNSIPNRQNTEKQENAKILLKEKANRYTYEGKFANFSFIKKIDRKDVNKKYAMTFADFKKMQVENKEFAK